MYCSETCRDSNWEKIHQFECKGILYGFFYDVGVAYLGFRTAFKAINALQSKETLLDAINGKHRVTFKSHRNSDSYMEVLLARISSEEICNEMLRKSTQILVYLTSKTDYFKYLSKKFDLDIDAAALMMFVGAKIFKHTAQVMCNASIITKEPLNLQNEGNFAVATGFFPSYCMMNHSCKPNISVMYV